MIYVVFSDKTSSFRLATSFKRMESIRKNNPHIEPRDLVKKMAEHVLSRKYHRTTNEVKWNKNGTCYVVNSRGRSTPDYVVTLAPYED
jgi:hypothetical protein